MTREEREQVVELLRCAADVDPHAENDMDTLGPVLAGWYLGHRSDSTFAPDRVSDLAAVAWQSVAQDLGIKWPHRVSADAYRLELLEAAARVEEGSWP